jgi:hypothetical protein
MPAPLFFWANGLWPSRAGATEADPSAGLIADVVSNGFCREVHTLVWFGDGDQ